MTSLVPDPLDEPWSIRALAEQADVSGTTLDNWAKRESHPLSVGTDESGARFITWHDLLEFRSKHPTQRGVKKVYAAARQRLEGATPTSDPGATPSPAQGETDPSTLRSGLAELKRALDESVTATGEAARAATAVERTHRDVVQRLEKIFRILDPRQPELRTYRRPAVRGQPSAQAPCRCRHNPQSGHHGASISSRARPRAVAAR